MPFIPMPSQSFNERLGKQGGRYGLALLFHTIEYMYALLQEFFRTLKILQFYDNIAMTLSQFDI